MKVIFLVLGLLISFKSHSQGVWFKHLPGWQARTSIIKDDTLLTTGQNVIKTPSGSKYGFFLYWSKLNGDSISLLKLNLDSLENDSTQSTTISYNYNSSVMGGDKVYHFIGLNYGRKKERAFLVTFKNFFSKKYVLEEYSKDTFSSYINNLIPLSALNIVFSPYAIIEKPLHVEFSTVIFKEHNGTRVKINEISNSSSYKYETTCHIKNTKSDKSFFFIKRQMWDYAGAPRMWADYIIKMDTNGNQLWQCYPNNRDSINTEGMQMVQKPNGNLLVSWCDDTYRPYKNPMGSNEPQPNRKCTIWFAEVDSNGKVLWRKNIRKYLSTKMIDTSQDLNHRKATLVNDGIVWTGNYSYYYYHNYLLKTDFDGNPIWYREYELYPSNTAEQEFKPYDVTATNDGGYVLTGEYISDKGNIFKNGCQLATIIKVDSFGCLEPGCQKADSVPVSIRPTQYLLHCKVYPNPANETVTIQLPLNIKGTYSLEVFSMTGKLIEKIAIHESTELNTIKYPTGFYLFKINNEQTHEMETHKISIVR